MLEFLFLVIQVIVRPSDYVCFIGWHDRLDKVIDKLVEVHPVEIGIVKLSPNLSDELLEIGEFGHLLNPVGMSESGLLVEKIA